MQKNEIAGLTPFGRCKGIQGVHLASTQKPPPTYRPLLRRPGTPKRPDPREPALAWVAPAGETGRARNRAVKVLQSSDVVYLSGGNTFHSLMHLRRSGLFSELRRFADRGGVLAGLSAGALLATPHIGLAAYPAFDRDENEVGLARSHWGAHDLVDFEFFPHYRASRRTREAMQSSSKRSRFPLYACGDGSGIVVEGDRFTAHGDVWLFNHGQMRKIQG